MTFIARVTVSDVDTKDGSTLIQAEAKEGEKVANPYADHEGQSAELDTINSNTEGKVTRFRVEAEIDGETKVQVGDVITFSGHWQS